MCKGQVLRFLHRSVTLLPQATVENLIEYQQEQTLVGALGCLFGPMLFTSGPCINANSQTRIYWAFL